MRRTVHLSGELHPAELNSALAHATLTRVRRGAYAAPVDGSGPQVAVARANNLIAAVHRQLSTPHVFSYASAALVWGLPLWTVPQQVHVVQKSGTGPRGARDTVRHRDNLTPEDVVELNGLPVTSLVRTVADCARVFSGRDGLTVVDAALRRGVDRSELLAAVPYKARGALRARAVIENADPGAESAGESVTRYELLRAGLPRPETQIRISTRLGNFRADMGWLRWKLLVEFDGFVKYSTLAAGDPARVVFEEKQRQEAVEEEGWRFLRVRMADLRHSDALVARVHRFVPGGWIPELRPHL